MGKRLDVDIPKSLFEFNGKTLLDRKIEIFNKYGFSEIIVVVGYKAEMVEDTVKKYDNVTLVYNPYYEQSQTMESISAALPYIKYCCVQTEADLTFDPKVLDELLLNSSNSMVHCEIQDTNCITVPHFINGKLSGYRREKEYRTGIQEPPNFVGPSHFTKKMLESMTKHNVESDYQLLYEEAAAIASSNDSIPLSILYYPNYKFWDLNKQEDFAKVESIIKTLDQEDAGTI
jgi:CTP:phosphocholine cytidylyltransferase-like protein